MEDRGELRGADRRPPVQADGDLRPEGASGLIAALSFDFLTSISFWIGVTILAGIYGVFTLGLQLNIGNTGIWNFGQAGFMAIGAYSMAIAYIVLGLPALVALALSLLCAVAAALFVGWPSLHLRAEYFAIAALAFSEIVRVVARNADGVTGGGEGTIALEFEHDGRAFSVAWQDTSDWIADLVPGLATAGPEYGQAPLLLVTWTILVLLALLLRTLRRTPWGRVLKAIGEDELAVASVGKNVRACKLQSLAIAASLGAVSGWLLALYLSSFNPDAFTSQVTLVGLVILIIGGLGSYMGVLLASLVMWTILEGMRFVDLPMSADRVAGLRFVLVGLVLMLLMAFRPRGLFGKQEEMVLGDG